MFSWLSQGQFYVLRNNVLFPIFFMNARGLDKHFCNLRVEAIEHVVSLKMETMCALFNIETTIPK